MQIAPNKMASHYNHQNNQTVPSSPSTYLNNAQDQNALPMHQSTTSNLEASPLPNNTTSPISDDSLPDGSSFYSKEFERKLKRSLPFIKSEPKKRFLNDWSTNTAILQSYPEYNKTHPEINQKIDLSSFQKPHLQATPQHTLPKQEYLMEFNLEGQDLSYKEKKTESKMWECTYCSASISSKSNLLKHFYMQHSNLAQKMNDDFYNPNDSTLNKKNLENQLIAYEEASSENGPQNLKCNQCEKSFSQHAHLSKHMTKVHSKNFSCQLCLKPFPSTYHVMRHLKSCLLTSNLNQTGIEQENVGVVNVTPGTKTWNCDQCDKSYLRKEGLSDHMKGKHLQNFNCKSCSNSFSKSYGLRRHIKSKACLLSGKQDLRNNLNRDNELITPKGMYPKQEKIGYTNFNAAQGDLHSTGNRHAQANYPIVTTYYNVVTLNANQGQNQRTNLPPYHLPPDTFKNQFESIQYQKLGSSEFVASENGKNRKWKCLICQKLFSERHKFVKHCKKFHSSDSFRQVSKVSQQAPNVFQLLPNLSKQVSNLSQQVPNLSSHVNKTTAKHPSPKCRITPNLQCEFCSNRPTRTHDLKRHTLNVHKKCIDCLRIFATKEEANKHLKSCYRKKPTNPKPSISGRKTFPNGSLLTSTQVILTEGYKPAVYTESAVSDKSGETMSPQTITIPQKCDFLNKGNSQFLNSKENKSQIDENNQTLNKTQDDPSSKNTDQTFIDRLKPIHSEAVYENNKFIEPYGGDELQPTAVSSSVKNDNLNGSYIQQHQEAKYECNICQQAFSRISTLKRHHLDGIHLKLGNSVKCINATNYQTLLHQNKFNQNVVKESIHQPEISDQSHVQIELHTLNNNLIKTKVPQTYLREETMFKVTNPNLQSTNQTSTKGNVNKQGLQSSPSNTHQESAVPKLSEKSVFPYSTNLANQTKLQISSANLNYIHTKQLQRIEKTIPSVPFNAPEYLQNKPDLSIRLISKPTQIIKTKAIKVNFAEGTSMDYQTKVDSPVAQEEVLDLSTKPKTKTVESSETLPEIEVVSNSARDTNTIQKVDPNENMVFTNPQQNAEVTEQEEARKNIMQFIFIINQLKCAAQIKMILETHQNNLQKQTMDSDSIDKIETNQPQMSNQDLVNESTSPD